MKMHRPLLAADAGALRPLIGELHMQMWGVCAPKLAADMGENTLFLLRTMKAPPSRTYWGDPYK